MSDAIAFLAFTQRGADLARRLREALGGTVTVSRESADFSLSAWTREAFARAEALVFVGAAGIAVRAAAPYVRSKASDPAVVVVDESGRYAVPILSGHLGGANDLARQIAAVCGAQAVITTATDGRGVFAVDEWAKRQNCAVVNPPAIRTVSSKLLAGETVPVRSDWPVAGAIPPGVALADGREGAAALTLTRPAEGVLWLAPKIAVLGVGCRRDTPAETLEKSFAAFVRDNGLCEASVVCAATIDLKSNEPGLLEFCRRHGWELKIFTAEQLQSVAGTFTASPFVRQIAGVDNVCERAAAAASGGAVRIRKTAGDGVTLALAAQPYHPDWRWQDE